MGDRANVYVADQGNPATGVFFYTHFEGYKLPCIVQHGLKKAAVAGRLGDTPYLARFIFSEPEVAWDQRHLHRRKDFRG